MNDFDFPELWKVKDVKPKKEEEEHKRVHQNRKTTVKLQYRSYVTQKLAKHFRIKASELKESTEMEQDVLYYPILEQYNFYNLIYAGHYEKVALDNMWIGEKFIKSGLYDSIISAREQVPRSRAMDVILAVYLQDKRIWFIYEVDEDAYDGIGGIFVKTEEGNFVIEPLEHFMSFHHPTVNDGN